jgi:DNA primase
MPEPRYSYDVEQVKERTDLLTLIGQYVALRKRGARYVGLCPFHQEKSPSFGVDPAKGFWHCFGCGKGGDAINFLMLSEGLEFPEAVERLAERAGIAPIERDAASVIRKEERDFLLEANEAAAAAYRAALRGKAGGPARAYLQARGLSLDDAERFGLGYAPAGWDALTKHLTGRGFSREVLEKAGLALAREPGGLFDRFRNRLMIPIYDRVGRVVGFGGRAMVKEDNPKYLNTGETPVFHKSRLLYGLNWGRKAMQERGRAIVTEGYFDTIACHLAGFTEAVATLGTALGEDHVRALRPLAEKVYLVFDADSAGVNAALRSQALFRQAGVDVRIVRLPAGHDPDTLIREGGPDAFERCLAGDLSPVEFELERLLQQHPQRDSESRVRLFRAAAGVLQPLPALERAVYAERLAERIGGAGDTALQQAILAEVGRLERGARREAPTAAPEGPTDVPLEREVLIAAVHDPEFAARAAVVPADAFTHPGYRAIFTALAAQAAGGAPDIRRVQVPEAHAALVAALVVRDPLPVEGLSPEHMLTRLLEEHQARHARARQTAVAEQTDALLRGAATGDPEAIRAWEAQLREKSRQRQKEIFGEEK